MPSRQQKRARSRAPAKKRRKGSVVFTAVVLAIVLAGGAAVALLRADRPDPTQERGAIVGEHWHAQYSVEICGRRLAPYPFVEGEVHTHGDGQIHIHPATQRFAGDNANLGAFFDSVETAVGVTEQGQRFIVLPDGSRYEDGGDCPDGGGPYDLEVLVNGEPYEGNPREYVVHEGDEVVVRFGPEATVATANPLSPQSPVGQQGGQQAPPEGETGGETGGSDSSTDGGSTDGGSTDGGGDGVG